jgi:hypothetical protein
MFFCQGFLPQLTGPHFKAPVTRSPALHDSRIHVAQRPWRGHARALLRSVSAHASPGCARTLLRSVSAHASPGCVRTLLRSVSAHASPGCVPTGPQTTSLNPALIYRYII